jgi:8-oxo-dGTP pyrophosphatase MutT (NUDIX family)
MRLGYRLAYRVLQVRAMLVSGDFRGVKCVLRDEEGRVLFVRHHYGARDQWELPGGGARRGEALAAAAERETAEELGADVPSWEEIGVARGQWYGREERLSVFAARWPGGPVRLDPVEIAVAEWFSLDDPPSPLGPATAGALEVLRSARA